MNLQNLRYVIFVAVSPDDTWFQITRPIVLVVLSQVIGIGVTITFKVIVLLFVRRLIFTGFFRKQPAGANVMLVILECWSLGLTVGTMLIRLGKLLAVSCFYIARIDTPMLAKGVGSVGAVPLDAYPIQFRKDLLVHDAHRHPYMERLGVTYMLKLRHGDDFGTRAGSAWRLIVVLALMPWLRRFRLDEDEKEESFGKAIEGGNNTKFEHPDDPHVMRREIETLRNRVKELETLLAREVLVY